MLAEQLMYIYPGTQPERDFFLQNDGFGPYIKRWAYSQPQPTQAELAAAELPAARAAAISANRAECSRRIFERYPAGRQLSASFGLYDSANVATMVDWIAANVAAENTAADAIEAATTVAAVEAVTVAWPA